MTKKDLSQAYYISLEIKELEREREKLRGRSYIGGTMGGPRGSDIGDRTAKRAIAEAELDQKIAELITKLNEERVRIVKYMQEIDDSLIRQIVYYRFFKLRSWERVARDIGGTNTADSVRKMLDRYLERGEA